MSTFPARAMRTVGGDGWYVAKFPCTSPHTSSTRQPFDQAARILMPETINSNCGGKFTFHLILSCIFFLGQAYPRALRASRKTPTPNLTSHLRTLPMASSSSSPLMAASSEAAVKPASSIIVPLEGLVIPKYAVVETTGGDH